VTRITIVGAGSSFTLGLLGDLYRVNDLWGSELVLYDINEESLEVMNKIVTRYVERTGVDLKVFATTNKIEALENTDFAIITIRAWGAEALKRFLSIPLRHGVAQVVGDTVGPSGILKGLFEIPAVLDIARTLEDVSPHALMINFTNPMTAICTAVQRGTKIRVVGLCHEIHQIRRLASRLLDLDIEKIIPEAGGINHLTWATSLKYGDEEIMDDFKEAVLKGKRWSVIEAHPYIVGRQLLMLYGHPPVSSDRHISEFFHYLYEWFRDPKIGPILRSVSMYIDYEKKTLSEQWIKMRNRMWERLKRIARGEEEIELWPAHEAAMDIISSIVNNKRRELLAINVPNDGYIDGIPKDYVVEVPGVVDGNGVRGRRIGRLSKPATAILNLHLEKFELLVKGILEEDKYLVLQAMAIDPLTPSPEKAKVILDEFLEESKDLLSISLK